MRKPVFVSIGSDETDILKDLENATLDSMPISSRRPNMSSSDNEIDKSDQLACIRYKKIKKFWLNIAVTLQQF